MGELESGEPKEGDLPNGLVPIAIGVEFAEETEGMGDEGWRGGLAIGEEEADDEEADPRGVMARGVREPEAETVRRF